MPGDRYAIGYYKGHAPEWPFKYRVEVARETLDNIFRFVTILTHELLHVRLLRGNELNEDLEQQHEIATDLGLIFRGFGLFHAETIHADGLGGVYMPGYLNLGTTANAISLVCWLSGREPREFKLYFQRSVYHNVMQNFSALESDEITTLLTAEAIANHEEIFASRTRSFQQLSSNDLLGLVANEKAAIEHFNNPNDHAALSVLHNNVGFYLGEAGEFKAATEALDQSLSYAPDSAFPYNNRGYSKMMLGEMESAWADFVQSQKLDHYNGWVYRNKGIWLLKQGRPAEALEQLTLAHTLDIHVPYVYLHMSEAHRALGNEEQAKVYAHRHEWFVANNGHQPILSL